MAKLQPRDRLALHHLSVKAYEASQSDPKLRKVLVDVILASVKNDQDDFKRALSFLLDFEYYLTKLFRHEFTECFGKSWPNVLKRECEASSRWMSHAAAMGKNPNLWSFETYFLTAVAALEFSPAFAGRMARHLGGDWKKRSSDIPHMRNALAHGRMHEIEPLNAYDDESVGFLEEIMEIAVFWSRCAEAAKKATNGASLKPCPDKKRRGVPPREGADG